VRPDSDVKLAAMNATILHYPPVTKYTLAGLPLGWIFWRWGLPYAILCHIAANAAHLDLQDGAEGYTRRRTTDILRVSNFIRRVHGG
jgi:hypothetical protein